MSSQIGKLDIRLDQSKPPLSVDSFRDALAKGLGRTAIALQAPGGSETYAEVLVEGCLHNLQFDRQLESNRAPYLVRLVELAGLQDRVLHEITSRLADEEEGWDRDLMIDLLEQFALRGSDPAWEALRNLAAAGEERAQDNLATTGPQGLEWVAQFVLPNLTPDDRWRISMWLPDDESEDSTETQKQLRLQLGEDREPYRSPGTSVDAAKLTPREFLDPNLGRSLGYGDSIDFVENATQDEIVEAANQLLSSPNPNQRRALGRVFERVPFPLPLERLFEKADDGEVGFYVRRILGQLNDPAVRSFGLDFIKLRPLRRSVTDILIESLQPGDEIHLWPVLSAAEAEERNLQHGIVSDLVEMIKNKEGIDWQPFAEWVYEHSPCSFCRESVVRWMAMHDRLPASIREEGVYDSERDIQDYVSTGLR